MQSCGWPMRTQFTANPQIAKGFFHHDEKWESLKSFASRTPPQVKIFDPDTTKTPPTIQPNNPIK
jgi:hypothetical protein